MKRVALAIVLGALAIALGWLACRGVLDEWGGDDADELFELLETQLGDIGVDLKYAPKEGDDEEEEDAVDLDDDEDDDDDDGVEEVDEEEEKEK